MNDPKKKHKKEHIITVLEFTEDTRREVFEKIYYDTNSYTNYSDLCLMFNVFYEYDLNIILNWVNDLCVVFNNFGVIYYLMAVNIKSNKIGLDWEISSLIDNWESNQEHNNLLFENHATRIYEDRSDHTHPNVIRGDLETTRKLIHILCKKIMQLEDKVKELDYELRHKDYE